MSSALFSKWPKRSRSGLAMLRCNDVGVVHVSTCFYFYLLELEYVRLISHALIKMKIVMI